MMQMISHKILILNYYFFQRTGPSDLYSKPPRLNPNNLMDNRGLHDHELEDFTDDETSPLTEPIYNGGR